MRSPRPVDDQPDGWVAHVPMDGFHLADAELLEARSAAPQGRARHLRRRRVRRAAAPPPRAQGTGETVYAPAFDRDLEQPVAGSIPVLPECRLVLTEGNYLLLDDAWRPVRAELDEVWFLEADDEVRRSRLVERHVRFGKSAARAEAWVCEVDEPNARLVAATRGHADVVVADSLLARRESRG